MHTNRRLRLVTLVACAPLAIACGRDSTTPDTTTQSAPPESQAGDRGVTDSAQGRDTTASNIVRADLANVHMHVEPGIVLSIKHLRGTVLPAKKGIIPALNDKKSMLFDIESANISIDTASLANVLNRHVFGYAKSPLRKLHVSIDGNEMIQTGQMKKVVWLPFRIRATMSLTPDNEIRVTPTSVSVIGIGVKGLSRQLGGLSKLIKLEPGHGARLDGNDFILSPTAMLPPPAIRGRLASIKLEPGGVRQTFGTSKAAEVPLARRSGSVARNYMYFHGGTLRFGKLTMSGTDLEIVDDNETNPFDYSLDRYQDHLVAGQSNTTPSDGLIVVMPDLRDIRIPERFRKR